MKDRPIPYSTPMVQARNEGRKTQTRRIVNPRTAKIVDEVFSANGHWTWDTLDYDFRPLCPYGHDEYGDRLWVREAWRTEARFDHLKPSQLPDDARIWYLADGPAPSWCGRYRHARFMPRRFSRGLDEVVAVRVERLQDINGSDALAEGVGSPVGTELVHGRVTDAWNLREYRRLWESINGPGSWEVNPWVWVVEFKRVVA